jgi:hypothetical protein
MERCSHIVLGAGAWTWHLEPVGIGIREGDSPGCESVKLNGKGAATEGRRRRKRLGRREDSWWCRWKVAAGGMAYRKASYC